MSIFGDILSKIFPSNHPAVAQAQTAGPVAASATTAGTPAGTVGAAAGSAPSATPAAASAPPVDVQQILSDKAAQSGQQLNWQTSIVDLLKLLGLDSGLAARKQLATELHYSGDTNDTASMNVWLIKQVMSQLAANGGKVPANLMH
jgi:hypothetical protein